MTIPKNLGRLEQITDLRNTWASEAGAFTPWLANDENLPLLGDTIGIELELEATERNVGPFRADILCKDTATDHWVLIENQLEKTDHTHLGQLLTYASGLKAATIVWVADRFTDEHRSALDWLNEITDTRFNFFGLEIELWRIGESAIAPKFNIVCEPNDWSRTVTGGSADPGDKELSERGLLQQAYWAQLRETLLDRKSVLRVPNALPQKRTWFAIGRSGFGLWASIDIKKRGVQVAMNIHHDDAGKYYHLLEQDRAAIDAELGENVVWEARPDRKGSRVTLTRHGMDPTDRAQWDEQHDWFIEKLETFHAVFGPRIKVLDVTDCEPDDAEDDE